MTRGTALRHGVCGLAFAAAALAGLVVIDQLGRRTAAPGAIWAVARGEPRALLAALPRQAGVRVLDAWAGGRIVLLHAPVLNAASLPHEATWIALRASPSAFSLPACG
ncbi:hypothetical protein WG922_16930 [Ramlibacter sp. AN1015]|uniref:hypothetical protein n=1 Tax=Ramlibacter sp. AN1015 TaxID=3133428 RepID=UPI0030BC1651